MHSVFDVPISNSSPPRIRALIVATVLCLAFSTNRTSAQTYFDNCISRTGNNATVVIPASAYIYLGSRSVQEEDEIAVFDAEGHCAGAVQWTGEHVALTVWGSDEIAPENAGLEPGEPMRFRLWSASDGQVWGGDDVTLTFADHKPYLTTENAYAPDRIYVIDSLRFGPLEQASR